MLDDVVQKLTTRNVFEEHVEMVTHGAHFEEPANVRMVEHLAQRSFSDGSSIAREFFFQLFLALEQLLLGFRRGEAGSVCACTILRPC